MSTKHMSGGVAGLLGAAAVLAVCGPVRAAEPDQVQIYRVSTQAPPVEHIVGTVRVHECRTQNTDAQGAVLEKLQKKAQAMGATAVVNVQVKMGESLIHTIKTGVNPCLFETDAEGEAAVLAAAPSVTQSGIQRQTAAEVATPR